MKKKSIIELDRLELEAYKAIEKFPIVIVLDNIRSAMNVGSIFRTADAFKVSSIQLCGITAKPPHKEISKTALGAELAVDWHYSDRTIDVLNNLRQDKFKVISIEQVHSSISLENFQVEANFEGKYAIVVGNEVNGVSEEVIEASDLFLEIPQFGTKHSINVSTSVGIILWHFYLNIIQK